MYFFAQDSFRVSSRLTLNYGVRYDNFGGPENTGATKDALLQLGPGGEFQCEAGFGDAGAADFGKRNRFSAPIMAIGRAASVSPGIRSGRARPSSAADTAFFTTRRSTTFGRTSAATILRWWTIRFASRRYSNYLAPMSSVLPGYANQTPHEFSGSNFPNMTLMDPNLRNGYAQDAFLGVQQSIGENLTLEVNGTASLGRRLITTDIVNRQFTTTTWGRAAERSRLPDVDWRSSQGNSDYTALSAIAKYHWRTLLFQAAYTWSHAIDDQSDPLNGDFFNLDFTADHQCEFHYPAVVFRARSSTATGTGETRTSTSGRICSCSASGRSDGRRLLTRGWQVSWMAAFRSGFPYTIASAVAKHAAFGARRD